LSPKLEQIVKELSEADRQERIELLIDFARSLPALPERLVPFKDAAHRVEECQTPVFLFVELKDGRVEIFADVPAESPTVRGFVAILVEGLTGATVEQILSVPNDLIEQLGLPEILGMLRMRGLHGLLNRLKAEATRAAIDATAGNRPAEASAPVASGNSSDAEAQSKKGESAMPDEAAILTALRTVKDPELNLNVVDLGLVYSVQTHDSEIDVEMTLTTPACPAGPEILRNAVSALEKLEGITKANVKLVMSPPWSPDRMSEAARDELGIF
jgi:cysteine desulfuration protein SufE